MKIQIDTLLRNFLGICLCLGIVFGQKEESSSLEMLVPNIDQQNFKLTSSGQHYTLTIILPDGSKRIENAELRNPNTPEQELAVMGHVKTIYPEGLSETEYEADKFGYTVEHVYQYTESPIHEIVQQVSIGALKSAAG